MQIERRGGSAGVYGGFGSLAPPWRGSGSTRQCGAGESSKNIADGDGVKANCTRTRGKGSADKRFRHCVYVDLLATHHEDRC